MLYTILVVFYTLLVKAFTCLLCFCFISSKTKLTTSERLCLLASCPPSDGRKKEKGLKKLAGSYLFDSLPSGKWPERISEAPSASEKVLSWRQTPSITSHPQLSNLAHIPGTHTSTHHHEPWQPSHGLWHLLFHLSSVFFFTVGKTHFCYQLTQCSLLSCNSHIQNALMHLIHISESTLVVRVNHLSQGWRFDPQLLHTYKIIYSSSTF